MSGRYHIAVAGEIQSIGGDEAPAQASSDRPAPATPRPKRLDDTTIVAREARVICGRGASAIIPQGEIRAGKPPAKPADDITSTSGRHVGEAPAPLVP